MAYPVSAQWVASLSAGASTTLIAYADVYANGGPIPGWQKLPIEQIQVSADRTSEQRTSATVIFSPTPGTAPTDLTSPLAPGTNEIILYVGWDYDPSDPGTDTEMVPLGIFPIVDCVVTVAATDTTIQSDVEDRSFSIARRALLQPYITDGETITIDQAISALIDANSSGLPPFSQSILPCSEIAPANTYQQGADPFAAAMDLANGAGYELYFDRAGNLNSLPTPDPATQSTSWTYGTTSGSGILTCARTLTINDVYNDIWVTTANTSSVITSTGTVTGAVMSEAADTSPQSPTYVNGSFGDIPDFINSATSTTAAAALAEAQTDLVQSLGQIDTIQLEVVLNAAVDIDDIVSVTCPAAGVSGALYVVDGYTATFMIGGTMTLSLRRVTY